MVFVQTVFASGAKPEESLQAVVSISKIQIISILNWNTTACAKTTSHKPFAKTVCGNSLSERHNCKTVCGNSLGERRIRKTACCKSSRNDNTCKTVCRIPWTRATSAEPVAANPQGRATSTKPVARHPEARNPCAIQFSSTCNGGMHLRIATYKIPSGRTPQGEQARNEAIPTSEGCTARCAPKRRVARV